MVNFFRKIYFSLTLFLLSLVLLQCKDDEDEVPPIVTSFEPTSGIVGSQVKIIGGNFQRVSNVFLNDVEAEITAVEDNQITIIVPAAATTSKIKVATPNVSTVTAGNFSVIHVPVYQIFHPKKV